ncbi:biopolymer transporter ExbD [Acetobacter sp. TBRC 12305]|uniref:Biopolymer transporter ExbD n=1 Tax=Acetobacter garciniae TaxID=2817435 RepID=A0A939HNB0_9PROT|nr:biopolymer transporter ExbD [Acetobacter garciniae]MBO1324562.1 biopolymer transporter ExbD [Acetobacter garciniae]MBX0344251.1 biopolymer transporter ExbD [Acetobacter garciniae]
MGMQVGGDSGEDDVVSAINTTPLVDVMLVLLIIFLITIPVATHSVKVSLPKDRSQATKTQVNNVVLAITPDGRVWWDQTPMADRADLASHLDKIAVQTPQPQIQIRGDAKVRYEAVGRVVAACQEAGIYHIDFITEKPK